MVLGALLLVAAGSCVARSAQAQSVREDLWGILGSVHAVALNAAEDTLYVGGDFRWAVAPVGAGAPVDLVSGLPPIGFPRITGGGAWAVAPDGSGGWYLGGDFTAVGGVPRSCLAHVLADHAVSPWNPGANRRVRALAVAGGVVYVGGEFSEIGPELEGRRYIAAVDAATGAVTSWNPDADNVVTSLAVSGSTVFAGGYFYSIGGAGRGCVAALDAATGLATPWAAPADVGIRVVVVSGGTVYLGGEFYRVGGQPRRYLAAVDEATGTVKPWNPNPDMWVNALAVYAGTVYAGGLFHEIGGESGRYGLAALDATTGLATDWNPWPVPPVVWSGVRSLAVGGGLVYVGGVFGSIGGAVRNGLAALDATTGLATAWNPGAGDVADGFGSNSVLSLALQAGSAFVGGYVMLGARRDHLAAFHVPTGQPTAWNPAPNGPVRALAALPNGAVYVGGDFTQIAGMYLEHLVALDATMALVQPCPEPDRPVLALTTDGDKVYVGGKFRALGGQIRLHIAAVVGGEAVPTGWNPVADGDVLCLALDDTTLYAGGDFHVIGSESRDHIAAVSTLGGAATAWDPDADDAVHALAVMDAAVYAGGVFSTVGGASRDRIAALDVVTGTAVPSWDPGTGGGTVLALCVGDGRLHLGGDFGSVNGVTRSGLAQLEVGSDVPTPWNPAPEGYFGGTPWIGALAAGSGTLYAGGSFEKMGGESHFSLAAIGTAATGVPGLQDDGLAVRLGRNAPNPFRTRTSIAFSLPRAGNVTLAVYDVSGRRAASLLDDERLGPGAHRIEFVPQGLPTGLYLCRLQAGTEVRTSKMLLLR